MLRVLNNEFDHPMELEERGAMFFGGGILQHGCQCGMVWGAALAAGTRAYQLYGPGPKAETKAIMASQKLEESFHGLNKHTNCLEITGLDKSSSALQMNMYFLMKGGMVSCFRMASRFTREAFREIDIIFSEEHPEKNSDVPSPPVSCAAMLAQKMGVSDEHVVMAAGLAGGIGLSGGGCGALGAAIWITTMNRVKEGVDKIDFKDTKTQEVIDRFMKCSDNELECSKIVGRKFENVGDHANYLHEGGCSKLIEVLAAV